MINGSAWLIEQWLTYHIAEPYICLFVALNLLLEYFVLFLIFSLFSNEISLNFLRDDECFRLWVGRSFPLLCNPLMLPFKLSDSQILMKLGFSNHNVLSNNNKTNIKGNKINSTKKVTSVSEINMDDNIMKQTITKVLYSLDEIGSKSSVTSNAKVTINDSESSYVISQANNDTIKTNMNVDNGISDNNVNTTTIRDDFNKVIVHIIFT